MNKPISKTSFFLNYFLKYYRKINPSFLYIDRFQAKTSQTTKESVYRSKKKRDKAKR